MEKWYYWNRVTVKGILEKFGSKLALDLTQQQDSIHDMPSADNLAFLARTPYANSMEERNERSSALSTTYMCYSMWIIDTQRTCGSALRACMIEFH
jgi:hypothetical protein